MGLREFVNGVYIYRCSMLELALLTFESRDFKAKATLAIPLQRQKAFNETVFDYLGIKALVKHNQVAGVDLFDAKHLNIAKWPKMFTPQPLRLSFPSMSSNKNPERVSKNAETDETTILCRPASRPPSCCRS